MLGAEKGCLTPFQQTTGEAALTLTSGIIGFVIDRRTRATFVIGRLAVGAEDPISPPPGSTRKCPELARDVAVQIPEQVSSAW